jgi:tRNA(Ile)-lysidine synthase
MGLLEGFFKFLKTQQLPLGEGSNTLLAISGGVDSMVLAQLFQSAKLSFALAHCNFQLRGAESDADEAFVKQVAENFGVPFFVKRFDTKEYAHENGLSTQMAARNLRYAWFVELAESHGFSNICTAHHLNDSVETALLNFARGTSLPGLSGIPVQKNLPVLSSSSIVPLLRPLLFAPREEILEYAKANEIEWREDSSNDSDDYARNFVRHQIVPRFEELNPNFSQTAARNMRRIKSADENLVFLMNRWLSTGFMDTDGLASSQTISKPLLTLEKQKLTLLPSPRQAIRQVLKPFGFDAEQTRQLSENLDHVGLELLSKSGFKVLVDREQLLVSPNHQITSSANHQIIIQQDDLMLSLPDGSRIFFLPDQIPTTSYQSSNNESILVDADKLCFPLHLRHWQPGDAFQPFGMGCKSQKLQDFFTNQKFSRLEKDEVWLLVNGDGVLVWIVGLRLDERFKIHSSTKKVLKINWIK